MAIWIKPLVAAVVSIVAARKSKRPLEKFLMRFFRDVGRAKAYKRRHGNSKGLIHFMIEKHPLTDLIKEEEDESRANLPSYTIEELLEFGDGLEGRPILIAVLGRVYDVSSGSKFYGEKGRYPFYAGRDITYALSTACTTEECSETLTDPTQMTKKQTMEAKRWLSFFHLHDKYPLVGMLEDDPLDEILRDALSDQGTLNSAKFAGCGYVIDRYEPNTGSENTDDNYKVSSDMEESIDQKPPNDNLYHPLLDDDEEEEAEGSLDDFDGNQEDEIEYLRDEDDEDDEGVEETVVDSDTNETDEAVPAIPDATSHSGHTEESVAA